jgi:hypothetical protein
MAGNGSPAMVLRVAPNPAPEEPFVHSRYSFATRREDPVKPAPDLRNVARVTEQSGNLVRWMGRANLRCSTSFCTHMVLKRGLKSNYLYKNSRFRNRRCPIQGNPPTYKEQLCLKVPPQNL